MKTFYTSFLILIVVTFSLGGNLSRSASKRSSHPLIVEAETRLLEAKEEITFEIVPELQQGSTLLKSPLSSSTSLIVTDFVLITGSLDRLHLPQAPPARS